MFYAVHLCCGQSIEEKKTKPRNDVGMEVMKKRTVKYPLNLETIIHCYFPTKKLLFLPDHIHTFVISRKGEITLKANRMPYLGCVCS